MRWNRITGAEVAMLPKFYSFTDPVRYKTSSLSSSSSGFWRRVDAQVDANVSEKHTVSIFGAKVAMLGIPLGFINPCTFQHRHFSKEDGVFV
jgi:hypothetical protein